MNKGYDQMKQGTSRSVEALMREALALHQAERFGEAERLYRTVLQLQPKHADASHSAKIAASSRLSAATEIGIAKPSPTAHARAAWSARLKNV